MTLFFKVHICSKINKLKNNLNINQTGWNNNARPGLELATIAYRAVPFPKLPKHFNFSLINHLGFNIYREVMKY